MEKPIIMVCEAILEWLCDAQGESIVKPVYEENKEISLNVADIFWPRGTSFDRAQLLQFPNNTG